MWWLVLVIVLVCAASHWFHHRYALKEAELKVRQERSNNLEELRKERESWAGQKRAYDANYDSNMEKHRNEIEDLNRKYALACDREGKAKSELRKLRGEYSTLESQYKQLQNRKK